MTAVTPGTPGGLMLMVAEFGRLSLAEVLAPAMEMARGYPIEATQAQFIESRRDILQQWPDSQRVFLPHYNADKPDQRAAPAPGELLAQPELLATLQKLVDAEAAALANGADRKTAIMAAYERFYRTELSRMGYQVEVVERTYNPTTAIWFDWEHGVMQGGASDYGDDYGIAW